MSAPVTIAWFARHEFRLAWRDGLAMMTAGRRTRVRTLVIVLAVFAVLMHGVAFAVVSPFAAMTAKSPRCRSRRSPSSAVPWLPICVQTLYCRAASRSARASCTVCVSGF